MNIFRKILGIHDRVAGLESLTDTMAARIITLQKEVDELKGVVCGASNNKSDSYHACAEADQKN